MPMPEGIFTGRVVPNLTVYQFTKFGASQQPEIVAGLGLTVRPRVKGVVFQYRKANFGRVAEVSSTLVNDFDMCLSSSESGLLQN